MSKEKIVEPAGKCTPIVIEVGYLVEFVYWRVTRIGFVTHLYDKKIRVLSEDEQGREVPRVVKRSNIIASYKELPSHIKYFR